MKDTHAGQTGLIIGNGPSLVSVPREFLRKYPSFGSNRIYLLDGFTPTYYAAVNEFIVKQFYQDIKEKLSKSMKFINQDFAHLIPGSIPIKRKPGGLVFQQDPLKGLHEGWTVTYTLLQLAYWMGFTTVLLVGVDHRYEHPGRPNQLLVSEGKYNNHFVEGYFPAGTRWHAPDLVRSAKSYQLARETYEADGRRIINLTEGTALDVFEKGRVSDW